MMPFLRPLLITTSYYSAIGLSDLRLFSDALYRNGRNGGSFKYILFKFRTARLYGNVCAFNPTHHFRSAYGYNNLSVFLHLSFYIFGGRQGLPDALERGF